ncbi:MAG: MBL fold metallo-hydrolase [Saprospiraceae bacterium]
MTQLAQFEFSPFAENTYLVYDETGACAVFDPGCYTEEERTALRDFILGKNLRVERLINTHCHLDHVFGNAFVHRTWGVLPEIHRGELPLLEHYPQVCLRYGIHGAEPSPIPQRFLEAGQIVEFGNTRLHLLFTPGHSPASLSFYCPDAGFVLAGDVLFLGSIGRTDLPGGDHDTLIESVRSQLFVLPDETVVYPGHGPATTIRHEKEYNPFF